MEEVLKSKDAGTVAFKAQNWAEAIKHYQ